MTIGMRSSNTGAIWFQTRDVPSRAPSMRGARFDVESACATELTARGSLASGLGRAPIVCGADEGPEPRGKYYRRWRAGADEGLLPAHAEWAAVVGLAAMISPSVAIAVGPIPIEIIEALSGHAGDVQCIDSEPRDLPSIEGLTMHTGYPNNVLGAQLAKLHDEHRDLSFVVIEPPDYPTQLANMLERLLDAPATTNTVIAVRGAGDTVVRDAFRQVVPAAWPKVVLVDLDFVPPRLVREAQGLGDIVGGLALVVTRFAALTLGARADQDRFIDARELLLHSRPSVLSLAEAQDAVEDPAVIPERITGAGYSALLRVTAERDHFRSEFLSVNDEFLRLVHVYSRVMESFSWRVTRPLRGVRHAVRRVRS